MDSEIFRTHFDSPERVDIPFMMNEYETLSKDGLISQMLEGFAEVGLLLNKHRQIIQANSSARAAFKVSDDFQIISKRIGEAISCIHQDDMPAGCGTSKFCRECGAAKAIKTHNESGLTSAEECRIISQQEGKEVYYDFWIKVTPFFYNNIEYSLVALKDIAQEKRKEALENIFFHDLLNISGTIKGAAKLLTEIDIQDEREKIQQILLDSTHQLINEINSQRDISEAEGGSLSPQIDPVSVNKMMRKIYDIYGKHEISRGKNFIAEYLDKDRIIFTDEAMLIRSLGNFIKNAFEASSNNETIKFYAGIFDDKIKLNVHNTRIIPLSVQYQIFQRSFSTKQKKGRGLGLYSVKMIVENYLNGRVSFVSHDGEGTTFTISLPLGESGEVRQ